MMLQMATINSFSWWDREMSIQGYTIPCPLTTKDCFKHLVVVLLPIVSIVPQSLSHYAYNALQITD